MEDKNNILQIYKDLFFKEKDVDSSSFLTMEEMSMSLVRKTIIPDRNCIQTKQPFLRMDWEMNNSMKKITEAMEESPVMIQKYKLKSNLHF